MKFVLFVEGETERRGLRPFLGRWLEPKFAKGVGIQVVSFSGWGDYHKEIKKKVEMHVKGPRKDVIGAIGLLDLHGLDIFPPGVTTVADRCKWGKSYFEKEVSNPLFRQHFAVHEIEAWLLAEPEKLPNKIGEALKVTHPEAVNHDEPPATLLKKLYKSKLKREYGKVNDGADILNRLDPAAVAERCPNLRLLLDDLMALARDAGLQAEGPA